MSKLLSIIIPVYNNSKYLKRCFESVLKLDSNDIEIIIIDDGSTDGSSEICDLYEAKNDNVIVKHIENSGVSRARNLGINLANSKYIMFLDSDDYFNIEELKNILVTIKEQYYDIYICNYSYIDMNGRTIYNSNNKDGEITNIDACNGLIFGKLCFAIGSIIVNSNISKCIMFNEQCRYGEDTEYIYKCLINSKKLIVLNSCIYNYINNSDSAMNTITTDRFDVVFARIRFYNYVCSNFPQYKELEDNLIKYNIPEAIAQLIINLPYEGIKYKPLSSYMNEKGINNVIDDLLAINIYPEFKCVFQEWKKGNFKFFLKRRFKCIKDTTKHSMYLMLKKLRWI